MKDYVCFFNLISFLIAKALSFEEYKNIQKLAPDEEIKINSFVDNLIIRYFGETLSEYKKRLSLSLEDLEKITNELNGKSFYYFSALITRLDKIIPDNLLYDILKYDTLAQTGVVEKYFESLNDNVDQTGIYIMPEISSADNGLFSKQKISHRARVENDLKSSLKKIFFISKKELNGFKIVNAVIDCKLKDKKYITIAATPLCNTAQNELISINHLTAMKNGVGISLLSVGVKNPQKVNETFKKFLLRCSREEDIDIALGPEILGTKEFTVVDDFGFNKEIRMLGDSNLPSIILPPTYSHNSTNVLTIFADSSEKLGEQHKQVPFDDKKAKEDLRNSTKEIFILHIKEIGRICFAICKDYLTDYADLLIKVLRANLVLCPSYSRSVASFHAAKGLAETYNCKIVWINCCSAFENRLKKGAFIGLVAGNYIPNSTKLIKCCNECNECNGCFFKIKMPLVASKEQYKDKNIIIQSLKI